VQWSAASGFLNVPLVLCAAPTDAGRWAACTLDDRHMELKIRVICENLPSTQLLDTVSGQSVVREHIHIGIQRGNEVIEAVPTNRKRVMFEPGFRVSPMLEGKTNFLGPYAKGRPTQRFFYLSWVVKDKEGNLTMFGRAKIHLSHLSWSQVEAAVRSGRGLSVAVSLTDKGGRPRCGSIRGDDLRWQE
jgi:hypothetical protein